MTWAMPPGIDALYFGNFPWSDPSMVLCIYRAGTRPTGHCYYAVEERHVDALLGAMGKAKDKAAVFQTMVLTGQIEPIPAAPA